MRVFSAKLEASTASCGISLSRIGERFGGLTEGAERTHDPHPVDGVYDHSFHELKHGQVASVEPFRALPGEQVKANSKNQECGRPQPEVVDAKQSGGLGHHEADAVPENCHRQDGYDDQSDDENRRHSIPS